MFHRLRLAHLLLPLSLLSASCGRRIYFPDSAPSFGFREKGHFKAFASAKAQGSSTTTTNVNGAPVDPLYGRAKAFALAADAGYAFAQHWAVYGAYRGVNNVHRSDFDSRNMLYNGRRAEAGAVYFASVGRHSTAEAMVGIGQGRLEAQSRDVMEQYSLSFLRYSLQGAISFQTTDEAIRGYGGLRVAVQDFYRFDSPDPMLRYTIGQPFLNNQPTNQQRAQSDILTRPLGVMEPYLGFEAGYRWIRFVGQSGFTVRYFGPRIGGGSFYATAGIGFQWPALPEKNVRRER